MAAKMSLIQQVARQAHQTFAGSREPEDLQEKLKVLKELMSKVKPSDVNFDAGLLTGEVNDVEKHAPVTYIHMWEDADSFSMGLFVLRKGVTLPLHDHPGMYGLIKVLHGKALVKRYSGVADKDIPEDVQIYLEGFPFQSSEYEMVQKQPDCIVDKSSEPCELSPNNNNFHEIKSLDGPLAFLDILAPPYDPHSDQRECHYYSDEFQSLSTMNFLLKIPQPEDYKSDEAPYEGPELSEDIVVGE